MGNTGVEAAATAAGGAATTGAKAAAEAESEADGAPSGQRPKPANRGSMTEAQRENWRKHTQALAKGKRWYWRPCTGALGPLVPEQQTLPWNQFKLVQVETGIATWEGELV